MAYPSPNVRKGVRFYLTPFFVWGDLGEPAGIQAARVAKSWVKGWLRIRATRFTTLPTCAFGARGNDGKPLAVATDGLADLGVQGTGESAAHADTCSVKGAGVVWAWEREILVGGGGKGPVADLGGCCGCGTVSGTAGLADSGLTSP